MTEERISITILNGKKPLITRGMTRQEAIEVMSNALFPYTDEDITQSNFLATRAFYALLGDEI